MSQEYDMDRYPEGEENSDEDCFDEDDLDEFADLVGFGNPREGAPDYMINIPLINIVNSNY